MISLFVLWCACYWDLDTNLDFSQNPLFMNDAADYQDVYSSYGESNKARLRKIAKAYDPNGFMNRQGGWQL